jgi:glycerol kinase
MEETEMLVGAIDQGTATTKFYLFNEQSEIVGSASRDHEQYFPEPGHAEHDPMEIWENTQQVMLDVLESTGTDASDINALGITNQRETTIVWDPETGEPVYNAIVWQDKRPMDRIDQLVEDGWEDTIRETTGLEPDPFFSAGEIEWILDNVEGARERAREGALIFGNIDTWLAWNLTGAHVTDVTNASRTMLFDIDGLEWDDTLLEEFGVPQEMLPEVQPSINDDYHGTTDPDGFLGAEIPVAGMLGDQQAALFGQARFEPGEVKHTVGTSCVMQMNIGTEVILSDHGANTTLGYQRSGEDPHYALEGQIFTGGQALAWLEEIGVIDDVAESAEMARSVESTDGVFFVPSFQGLATPYWNPAARGTMFGLERGTSREVIVRAALDGIAYRTRDAIEALRADSGLDIASIRVDGGMSKNGYLCQRLADMMSVDVDRGEILETTALGVAYAAGLAAGVWPDMETIRDRWRLSERFERNVDPEEMDAQYERWQEAVELSQQWS